EVSSARYLISSFLRILLRISSWFCSQSRRCHYHPVTSEIKKSVHSRLNQRLFILAGFKAGLASRRRGNSEAQQVDKSTSCMASVLALGRNSRRCGSRNVDCFHQDLPHPLDPFSHHGF